MILEGFEIENWSCIERLTVHDLPTTGVVVLHGPNRTGKSSIIAALRACLMDYPTNSGKQDLKRWFCRNSDLKPRISVTFRSAGAMWRVTKKFGTKDSKLESRTSTGGWKVEAVTTSEVHEKTCQLSGSNKSTAGLHQLLWLTQTEFHLPTPKEFDTDVQAQLRKVLGVLQTPLDDQFLASVKDRWANWYTAHNKPGDKADPKATCSLTQNQERLATNQAELQTKEAEFQAVEAKLKRSGDLQVLSRNLDRDLGEKTVFRERLQREYEKSLTRLDAHKTAEGAVSRAEGELEAATEKRKSRADAEKVSLGEQEEAEMARGDAEEKTRLLKTAEDDLGGLRRRLTALQGEVRGLRTRRDTVNGELRLLRLQENLKNAQADLQSAEQAEKDFDDLKKQQDEHPAIDSDLLKTLGGNRRDGAKLRAELQAAAITLTLAPAMGAADAKLTVDSGAPEELTGAAQNEPLQRSIRRKATIAIPAWGRIHLARGSDTRGLDEIETNLASLDQRFADTVARFGIKSNDPNALEQLREWRAAQQARKPHLGSSGQCVL